jgi:hypothetical protein
VVVVVVVIIVVIQIHVLFCPVHKIRGTLYHLYYSLIIFKISFSYQLLYFCSNSLDLETGLSHATDSGELHNYFFTSSTSFFPTSEVASAILLHMMQTDPVVWSQWDLPLPCDAAVMNLGVLKSQVPSPYGH